jgi:hypothetical protein
MNQDLLNDVWDPISDIDKAKRLPTEWANIYHVKLISEVPYELWTEIEWSFYMSNMEYYPLPDRDNKGKLLDSYDKSSMMEMKAMKLKRDLFKSADMGEKYILDIEKKFIETEWAKRRMMI